MKDLRDHRIDPKVCVTKDDILLFGGKDELGIQLVTYQSIVTGAMGYMTDQADQMNVVALRNTD